MSDLQLSLLAIGAVVVAAVYLYNWWQERRLRLKLQQAFGEERDDALMKAPVEAAPRIEPQVRLEPQLQSAGGGDVDLDPEPEPVAPALSAAEPAEAVVAVAAPVPDVPWFDEALDYVAELCASDAVNAAVVAELLSKVAAAGKPCRVAGYDEARDEWQDLSRTGGGHHRRLRFALQLVTRNGAVTASQLATLTEALRACAARIGGSTDEPDVREALERAKALDAFCADMDIAIGLNIVAVAGASFSGPDIRTHAEAVGFTLEPDGVFYFHDGAGQTLFTLDNHEPLPFLPEQIRSLTTAGITLLLDVPRVAGGKRALQLMVGTARELAEALGGNLVDDNRAPLNPAGVAAIGQQLEEIASAMEARGIAPGGERALRLFS